MKSVLCFIAALLLGAVPPLVNNTHGAFPDDRTRIKDVLFEVGKVYPEMIFGWEFGGRGNLIITDFPSIQAATEKKDLVTVAKLIAEQTDYECIVDTNSFTVVPKPVPELGGVILAEQQVIYPLSDNVPVGEFLGTISIEENKASAHPPLLEGPVTSPVGVRGTVTIQGGGGTCYKLLNEVCRQLKARSWIIIRWGGTIPAQNGLPAREILGRGDVTFQEKAEFHQWVE